MKSAAKLKNCEKTNSGNYVARCLFTPIPPNPPLFLFGWRGEGRKGGTTETNVSAALRMTKNEVDGVPQLFGHTRVFSRIESLNSSANFWSTKFALQCILQACTRSRKNPRSVQFHVQKKLAVSSRSRSKI